MRCVIFFSKKDRFFAKKNIKCLGGTKVNKPRRAYNTDFHIYIILFKNLLSFSDKNCIKKPYLYISYCYIRQLTNQKHIRSQNLKFFQIKRYHS